MTRVLFRKKSDTFRLLLIGGALAIAGAALISFGMKPGFVLLIAGLPLSGLALLRGRIPLVTFEATRLLLRFTAPLAVPFHSIALVNTLKDQDLELVLQNGSRILLPMAKLEEEDGAWLRKALRKEVRLANA